MEQHHVFIPSRGRWHDRVKVASWWQNEGFITHFVVEPNEIDKYHISRNDLDVLIHPLPRPDMGIAFSRHHCVDIAASYGCPAIIMADDDIKPGSLKRASNMKSMLESAVHSKVLGITARYGYHDLCLGDAIRGRSDLILLPTGTFRLVALNVDNVLRIGNYDRSLEYAEDCDLFLRGIKAGFPWMVDLGSWATSQGNRYEPGGMTDYVGEFDMRDAKEIWHYALYNRYPEVVNNPERVKDWTKQNTITIQWQRAYDLWLPDWREWSALHGGHLAKYLVTHKVAK